MQFALFSATTTRELIMPKRPMDEHLQRVRHWLSENVQNPETPNAIEISDVFFDWNNLRGSFKLSLDDIPLADRFEIGIEITGRITIAAPMFVSPLGAPASYAAVNLSKRTEAAIYDALQDVFPKIRPFGWNKDIDLIIDSTTPFKKRIIDQSDFDAKKLRLERQAITLRRRLQNGTE
ncbi:MAG: hypothetical protein WCS09_16280 [Pseudomonadota bacterium]